jgi:Xaa-Pro dipeptidase
MDRGLATSYDRHLETLNARLTAALGRAGLDRLVVHAGVPPVPYWDDQPYAFRPQPLFVQWCPLTDAAGSAVILAPDMPPRLVLLRHNDFWHAPPTEPDADWAGRFEIEPVASTAERDRLLAGLGPHSASIGNGRDDGPGDDAAETARRCLDYDRAVKTDFEIERIATANRTAAAGHAAVASAFAAGASELELDFTYMQASRQRVDELPYPNIVALNQHAAVLHYQRLDRLPPAAATTLLIDAGARDGGYAADITRTHLAPTSPLDELLRSMESLQQTLCTEALAGTEFTALNERAHRLLAVILSEHGLVRCDAEMAFESGVTRVFLPHGLGHLLGLQVHDAAGRQREPLASPTAPPAEHPYLRLTRRLEPGFVVTIEPGIYFIGSLYAALPASRRRLIDRSRFEALEPHGGIRIEDDVAVGAGDNTNLTRAAFAAL